MECLLFFIEWLTRHIYIICFPFFLFESPIVSFIRNWLSTGGKQRQHKGTTIMPNNSTLPSLGDLLQEAENLREFVSIIQLVKYTNCGCLVSPSCSRRGMSADWEWFRKISVGIDFIPLQLWLVLYLSQVGLIINSYRSVITLESEFSVMWVCSIRNPQNYRPIFITSTFF